MVNMDQGVLLEPQQIYGTPKVKPSSNCQMNHVVPDVVEFVCFLPHCSCLSDYASVSEQDVLHPYHHFHHQHTTHHLSRTSCCQIKWLV